MNEKDKRDSRRVACRSLRHRTSCSHSLHQPPGITTL